MKVFIKSISTGFLTLSILACSAQEQAKSVSSGDPNKAPIQVPVQLVEANQDFTFTLLDQLISENPGENIFYSPTSISMALAMVQAATAGNTSAEIKQALQLGNIEDEALLGNIALYVEQMQQHQQRSEFDLKLANRMWIDHSFPVRDSFRQISNHVFNAEIGEVDFYNAPEDSRLMINDWVADQTNQLIPDLFPSGSITSDTRMTLANAIYFKGQWDLEFDPELTEISPFWDASGKSLIDDSVELMNQVGRFPYAEQNGVQVVSLPYQGAEVSMLVVLPQQGSSIQATLQNHVDAQAIQSWMSLLSMERINLSLPKFKVETDYELRPILASLGMSQAFTEHADFSPLTDETRLAVSSVMHKAFIEVNEEGTEAAAATGVIIETTSIPADPIEFRADRPFLYFIVENRSGNVLFAGVLNQPEQ